MASPVKRRVLAPLDTNTSMAVVSAAPLAGKTSANTDATVGGMLPLSPPSSVETKKRPSPHDAAATAGSGSETFSFPTAAAAAAETPSKKACFANRTSATAIAAAPSRLSLSPATSSVFDLSAAANASQVTSITEPEPEAPRQPNASRTLTREQSRQRAEILKLRLGLARYKLRTGQVDVPLEQLRVVPAASQQRLPHGQALSLPLSSLSSYACRAQPSPPRREWCAGEWVRQQQQQQQQQQQNEQGQQQQLAATAQPRQPAPLPRRFALWGPASSSANSQDGGGRDGADERSASETDEDDGDVLDSRPLPQQPRPHRLDTIDVVEDSEPEPDVPGPRPRENDGKDEGEAEDEAEDEAGKEDDEEGAPQLPQIRRLSPTKKPASALTTPRGNRHIDGLTSSAMRGSAVNGLLSLARS